jgi:hypothetical protein
MDELFDLYNKSSKFGPFGGQAVVGAPRADPKDHFPVIQSYLKEAVHCFGNSKFKNVFIYIQKLRML